MANHLTRVPKLSVEASRTLTGGEEEEKKTLKPHFEPSKGHSFSLLLKSLISKEKIFSQKQLFYHA